MRRASPAAAPGGSKNTIRAGIALVAGSVGLCALLLVNPDLGVFALLGLADVGIAAATAGWFAIAAIRARERFRCVAYGYLALVSGALLWAVIDM